jgi:hypothetical protein
MEKLAAPIADGVPEITPVEELRLRPAGSDPKRMAYVTGAVPPVTTNGWEYGVPRVPPGIALVTMNIAGEIVIVKDREAVAPA